MYPLIYGLFYLDSLLPFWFLYGISDLAYFILVHIIHYRKDVVMYNLDIAFPEKSQAEKHRIRKKFYRNFTDNFIETIKLLSISPKVLSKRFQKVNPELLDELEAKGKNVTMLLGHFFNWEFANQAYALTLHQEQIVVYMPLKSKIMDQIFLKLRGRVKTKLVSAHRFATEVKQYLDKPHVLVLVGDQNPGDPAKAYWANFFGHLIPFVNGPEKTARLANNAVVFCKIKRIKRGYYESSLKLITEESRPTKKGEITNEMISIIETAIREDPTTYLWSHKRFKHEGASAEYKRTII